MVPRARTKRFVGNAASGSVASACPNLKDRSLEGLRQLCAQIGELLLLAGIVLFAAFEEIFVHFNVHLLSGPEEPVGRLLGLMQRNSAPMNGRTRA